MRPVHTTAVIASALAVGLSACTVSVRPNLTLQASGGNLISGLKPDRGEGSSYAVGENVRINVGTRAAGYVTLVALQSNGYASVLARNVYVQPGTTSFPRAQDGVVYTIAPPRGIQRVRAIFTRVRPTTDLVISGYYDGDRWNTFTNAYVSPYPQADRDVQETFFYIR
ncbi:hypothetical protein HNQ07_002498 [Deinococcus metalli]|uniref:DUF4384 domain-containing protein n=1 Tax=Deinococcus metalli TaxID=1141878 RepID=A0A7W8KFL7_9DEIO|nr:DUF4384 domain-containing protein [Deinococcus metalli]MBB5377025.1 hypothetical protein [Deinococcus metalli]GHF49468.1 hypothetical protein GCM10017781_27500 [Deinococcus metalli]